MIEIDGSFIEAGGQILRIAFSLSCLLKEPVSIINIREFCPKSGLSEEHKSGIDLLKQITNAEVRGCTIGSKEILFNPSSIRSGTFSADTGKEGNIALLLQVALPVLCFAGQSSTLDLRGVTDTLYGPQIDFITEILRPNLQKFGVTFDLKLHERGYYPHGDGHVEVTINPVKVINSTEITAFGQVKQFFGRSFVSGSLSKRIAHEMEEGFVKALPPYLTNVPINIQVYEEKREAKRTFPEIIVGFETTTGCKLGSSGLVCNKEPPFALGTRIGKELELNENLPVNIQAYEGEREAQRIFPEIIVGFETTTGSSGLVCNKEPPFAVGTRIGKELELYANCQSCTDIYVQDQLLIFMALSTGVSRIRTVAPTVHTKMAVYIIEKMAKASFKFRNQRRDEWIIECTGIGFVNNQI